MTSNLSAITSRSCLLKTEQEPSMTLWKVELGPSRSGFRTHLLRRHVERFWLHTYGHLQRFWLHTYGHLQRFWLHTYGHLQRFWLLHTYGHLQRFWLHTYGHLQRFWLHTYGHLRAQAPWCPSKGKVYTRWKDFRTLMIKINIPTTTFIILIYGKCCDLVDLDLPEISDLRT